MSDRLPPGLGFTWEQRAKILQGELEKCKAELERQKTIASTLVSEELFRDMMRQRDQLLSTLARMEIKLNTKNKTSFQIPSSATCGEKVLLVLFGWLIWYWKMYKATRGRH